MKLYKYFLLLPLFFFSFIPNTLADTFDNSSYGSSNSNSTISNSNFGRYVINTKDLSTLDNIIFSIYNDNIATLTFDFRTSTSTGTIATTSITTANTNTYIETDLNIPTIDVSSYDYIYLYVSSDSSQTNGIGYFSNTSNPIDYFLYPIIRLTGSTWGFNANIPFQKIDYTLDSTTVCGCN